MLIALILILFLYTIHSQAYLSRRRRRNHIVVVVLWFARLHVLVQNADLLHVVPAGWTKNNNVQEDENQPMGTQLEATYIKTASFSTTNAGVRNGKS